MSYTLFDSHSLIALTSFTGFNGIGYILFNEAGTSNLYYKNYLYGIEDAPKLLSGIQAVDKKEICFYINTYTHEIVMGYTTNYDEIYLLILNDTPDGDVFILQPDAKIIDGGKQPVIVYDPYANAYLVFYVDTNDNKMYQCLVRPYDTNLGRTLTDESVANNIEKSEGSNFRRISLVTTQVSENGYSNIYSILYDNSKNQSIIS